MGWSPLLLDVLLMGGIFQISLLAEIPTELRENSIRLVALNFLQNRAERDGRRGVDTG